MPVGKRNLKVGLQIQVSKHISIFQGIYDPMDGLKNTLTFIVGYCNVVYDIRSEGDSYERGSEEFTTS
jgi:hypothetical protein